ncbi:MAG: glycosyl transferase family 2, partial [Myxococcales bacterium]|nr:glycosyl transferase family 2 [Myxococcales bacterium]
GALSFMPLSLLMPVTYALLTPLALFTLDSGSWETRGHEVPEAEATPEPIADLVTGQVALVPATIGAETVRTARQARARSQAQLPAA